MGSGTGVSRCLTPFYEVVQGLKAGANGVGIPDLLLALRPQF